MSSPPQRVRVTRTRRPTRKDQPRTVRDEIAGNSGLGNTYVSSLVRAQLHLSLSFLAFGAVTLGALPLFFALIPATRSLTVFDLPLSWIILGVLVYPGVVLTARRYIRASERIEADFTDLVSRR